MSVDIREEALTLTALEGHAAIPIAFVVDRILTVTLIDDGLGGMLLTETVVDDPYVKDYDVTDEPASWPGRFDTSNWGLVCARRDGARAGGAAIAFDTRALAWRALGTMPRCSGISAFRPVSAARASGRRSSGPPGTGPAPAAANGSRSKPRTSTRRPATSRKMGCTLGAIDRFAYPGLPGEVQLLWWKALAGDY